MIILKYLYFLSVYFFFFIIIFSGLSKILNQKVEGIEANEHSGILISLLYLSEKKHFAFIEIFIGGLFLIPIINLHIVSSILVFMIIFLGYVIRIKHPSVSCNCFGEKLSEIKSKGLLILSIIALIIINVESYYSFFEFDGYKILEWSIFILITLIVFFLIKKTQSQKSTNIVDNSEDFGNFDPTTFLGFQGKQKVFMSKFAEKGKPIFLIGIDSLCPQCKNLASDILGFAKGFGEQFPIVIITNDKDYIKEECGNLKIIVDTSREFMRSQNLDGMPYAYLIYDDNLEKMSPPVFGAEGVRTLFSVMLNARNLD